MQVISQLTIDMVTPGLVPMLEGVQGDTARSVCLRLLENGKSWEIPQDAQVLIRYRNANGQGGVFDTLPDGNIAYAISGNTLTLTLPAQVWSAPGITKVQAVILQGQAQVSVFAFDALCEGVCAGQPAGEYTNIAAWLKENGIAPKRGVDYWTEDDINEIQGYIDQRLAVVEYGAY